FAPEAVDAAATPDAFAAQLDRALNSPQPLEGAAEPDGPSSQEGDADASADGTARSGEDEGHAPHDQRERSSSLDAVRALVENVMAGRTQPTAHDTVRATVHPAPSRTAPRPPSVPLTSRTEVAVRDLDALVPEMR